MHLQKVWPAVQRLIHLLNATDSDLSAHSRRTARIAIDIAQEMELVESQIEILSVASELHDIGKLFVPDDILQHPGPLTESQWVELRHHPRMGYELVRDRVDADVARIVVTHHERFDGRGYPDGLTGSSIPSAARILQVADAFDAITNERPYQPALPLEFAVTELIRCSGTQFDPQPVRALLELATSPEWRAAVIPPASDTDLAAVAS